MRGRVLLFALGEGPAQVDMIPANRESPGLPSTFSTKAAPKRTGCTPVPWAPSTAKGECRHSTAERERVGLVPRIHSMMMMMG
jgi:hypothetical protein